MITRVNSFMKKITLLILFCFPLMAWAQLYACRDVVKDGYDFWLYVPENYNVAVKKPVIMFLHGKSLSGNDLSLVRRYGCIDAVMRNRQIDAIIVAPQTNCGWNPKKVMDVYDWVKGHYSVDTDRFYVIGMSMGGYGTIDVAATYPDKVAAAMAMCGGATVSSLCGLNDLPLWIIHGTADNAVPVGCSQTVVDAMCSCGDTSRLIFDKLKGVNHTRLARIFYLDQTYKWLFSHSLTDSSRMVNRDYTINNALMKDAYADLHTNHNIKVLDWNNTEQASAGRRAYIVKKGDTLSKIAVENNTTVSIICNINKIKKDAKLSVGKKLLLPK